MTRRVLTFGEALIDVYPDAERVAGAPLHVATHLAAFGWTARLVSRVGDDEDGRRIREELRRRGVDDTLVETDEVLPTGRVTIGFDGSGGHDFSIHRPAAWDAIAGPDAWPPCDALLHGSLAGRDPRSRATLAALLEQHAALRVFDVNLRPPDVVPEVLDAGLRRAHLLKLNDDELEQVAGWLGLPDEPAGWFGDRAPELRWICVTHGSEGATLHGPGDERHRIGGADDVEVVDTVGAGDAFTAGLVDGLCRGWEPGRVLAHARDTSARVLCRRGGLPEPATR